MSVVNGNTEVSNQERFSVERGRLPGRLRRRRAIAAPRPRGGNLLGVADGAKHHFGFRRRRHDVRRHAASDQSDGVMRPPQHRIRTAAAASAAAPAHRAACRWPIRPVPETTSAPPGRPPSAAGATRRGRIARGDCPSARRRSETAIHSPACWPRARRRCPALRRRRTPARRGVSPSRRSRSAAATCAARIPWRRTTRVRCRRSPETRLGRTAARSRSASRRRPRRIGDGRDDVESRRSDALLGDGKAAVAEVVGQPASGARLRARSSSRCRRARGQRDARRRASTESTPRAPCACRFGNRGT